MKRIAFYSREFRLCEWPEEPKKETFYKDKEGREDYKMAMGFYQEAIASAMENGVAFDDQERIKSWLLNTKGSWQPKEGDNWLAPEGAEIGWQWFDELKHEWNDCTGTVYQMFSRDKVHPVRKVAILRSERELDIPGFDDYNNLIHESENVEKKESPALDGVLPCPFCGVMPEWYGEAIPDSQFYLRCPECQFIMKFDRRDKVIGMWNRRVNQSTPKE